MSVRGKANEVAKRLKKGIKPMFKRNRWHIRKGDEVQSVGKHANLSCSLAGGGVCPMPMHVACQRLPCPASAPQVQVLRGPLKGTQGDLHA